MGDGREVQERGYICVQAQVVKNLPARQVQSVGHEDPLEKGMAAHSSILGWRIPWTGEPGRLQSMDGKESDMSGQQHFHTFHTFHYIVNSFCFTAETNTTV